MTATVHATLLDRQRLLRIADWLAFGVAVSLPWSTSATGVLLALWLVAILLTLDVRLVWREVASPAGGLPVVLWLVAAFGMLWAHVSWADRFGGLEGYDRLLVVPVLLAQFRRSDNGARVLYGYLGSAICLLLTSWAFGLIPALSSHGNFYGVPVKDYVVQSDEFLICGFALLGVAGQLGARRRWRAASILAAMGVLFLANLAFIFTSRTGMLVAPILVAALGWRLSGAKGMAIAGLTAAVLGPALWFSSPHLRDFALQSVSDVQAYSTTNAVTSSGMHIEFLRKSIEITKDAPVFGHGTGSIAAQFRRAAAGESGAEGVGSVNPHNQIFAVAIQLGAVGAIMLAAMWMAHLLLFRGGDAAAWIGTVVVIENVVSSAVNSHLFDFTQGWLYVFGVGVAGGIALRQGATAPPAPPPDATS